MGIVGDGSGFALHLAPSVVQTQDFNRVWKEHIDYVLTQLRRMGVDPAEVEDVGQLVMLTVFKELPSFEGRSQLRTWIGGIAQNVARTEIRKRARRRRIFKVFTLCSQVFGCAVKDARAAVHYRDRAALLSQALSTLPEKQRIPGALPPLALRRPDASQAGADARTRTRCGDAG